MTLAEAINTIKSARDSGSPVNVILGDHQSAGSHPTKESMSWAHVCVAELMRLGWVEQAVDLHPKTPLVSACALIDVFPPLRTEPIATSGPVIYKLSPEMLPRLEGKGTWIVAGMNGRNATLPPVSCLWVRQFDQPAPAQTITIDAFDAESFFACILEAFDEFPPRSVWGASSKPQRASQGESTPAQRLCGMLNYYSQDGWKRASALYNELVGSYPQSKPIPDPFAWADKIERAAELSSRLGGQERGSTGAPLMDGLADGQAPRVANQMLERAERLYRHSEGPQQHAFPLIASTLWKRAKLQSGEVVDRLYREADSFMARAQSHRVWLKRWGEMLADWAERTSSEAESARLFDAALEKLKEALRIETKGALRSSIARDHISIHVLYVRLVELRARKLGTAMPVRYFDAARQHCQKLIESPESWRGYFCLGMIDVYQTRTESPENVLRAIELVPEQKVALLSDWGTALMETGQLTEAYQKFTESAALDEKAYIPHVNMSAIRLRQSRAGQSMLDETVHHAEIAESIKPGTGAYNLACAASQRRDRQGIEKWLNVSAEKGYLGNRDSIGADPDFQLLAAEPWFQALLDRLLPS